MTGARLRSQLETMQDNSGYGRARRPGRAVRFRTGGENRSGRRDKRPRAIQERLRPVAGQSELLTIPIRPGE